MPMGSIKTSGEKKRLTKARRTNKPVPTWVIVRTNRRVRTTPKRRHWRSRKLKV
jgi:large subunit ribosomal protein L39e